MTKRIQRHSFLPLLINLNLDITTQTKYLKKTKTYFKNLIFYYITKNISEKNLWLYLYNILITHLKDPYHGKN